jgi:hypothetical protein
MTAPIPGFAEIRSMLVTLRKREGATVTALSAQPSLQLALFAADPPNAREILEYILTYSIALRKGNDLGLRALLNSFGFGPSNSRTLLSRREDFLLECISNITMNDLEHVEQIELDNLAADIFEMKLAGDALIDAARSNSLRYATVSPARRRAEALFNAVMTFRFGLLDRLAHDNQEAPEHITGVELDPAEGRKIIAEGTILAAKIEDLRIVEYTEVSGDDARPGFSVGKTLRPNPLQALIIDNPASWPRPAITFQLEFIGQLPKSVFAVSATYLTDLTLNPPTLLPLLKDGQVGLAIVAPKMNKYFAVSWV